MHSKQQTANSKQQTANSKQQTANSKQQTANSKQQTIYYVFVTFLRTGGDYVNLAHIRALNKYGYCAKILYMGTDLRLLDYFKEFSVITHNQCSSITSDDIIVMPECGRTLYDSIVSAPTKRIIMHNQNPFLTWQAFDSINHLNNSSLHCVITSSHFTTRMLHDIGIRKPMYVIYPYIPSYFYPAKKSNFPVKIVFSARKRRVETHIVLFYFKSLFRNCSAKINFINLEGLTREQVAEEMRTASIFASFAERESLGLMTLEAMASGCHIVGFSGFTSQSDFFDDSNGDWIKEGDYKQFAYKLLEAVERSWQGEVNPKVQAGLELINRRFRQEHFEHDLVVAYQQIMAELNSI